MADVAEITEHNGQRQHALMMALARGEMPYGQFVQEDTLIGIRTAAAIRPFTREARVIGSHLTHRWRRQFDERTRLCLAQFPASWENTGNYAVLCIKHT